MLAFVAYRLVALLRNSFSDLPIEVNANSKQNPSLTLISSHGVSLCGVIVIRISLTMFIVLSYHAKYVHLLQYLNVILCYEHKLFTECARVREFTRLAQ